MRHSAQVIRTELTSARTVRVAGSRIVRRPRRIATASRDGASSPDLAACRQPGYRPLRPAPTRYARTPDGTAPSRRRSSSVVTADGGDRDQRSRCCCRRTSKGRAPRLGPPSAGRRRRSGAARAGVGGGPRSGDAAAGDLQLCRSASTRSASGRRADECGSTRRSSAGRAAARRTPTDARFGDGAWDEQPALLRLDAALPAPSRPADRRRRPRPACRRRSRRRRRWQPGLLADALAPTNFLLGNPEALRTAVRTRGASLVGGLRNLAHDLIYNDGWPSQVDVRPVRGRARTSPAPGQGDLP